MISLEIDWTRIILLHTNSLVVYCNCIKFDQYQSVGEELCLQEIWTDGRPDKQTDKQTDRFIYTHPKTNDDVIANVILH